MKKLLQYVFIDGLSGMALGLFSTLIIGTILQQLGNLLFLSPLPSSIPLALVRFGKIASCLTSAGIGVGLACKYKGSALITLASAVAGFVGGYASPILSDKLFTDSGLLLSGPGEPLGAFIAAFVAFTCAKIVSGRTTLDIILTPLTGILTGSAVGLLVGPPISAFMNTIGSFINWGVEQQPFLMGIIVSVTMGIMLTLPISSAALGIILNLSGLAAGAATVGCCCNMIGFATASFKENKISGLFAQGLGTSMLQIPNIIKKPLIWLPAILSSAVLGPVSTMLFKMTNNATGSGMGTAGLVGPLMTWETMKGSHDLGFLTLKILCIQFLLPALLSLLFSYLLRKKGLIKTGDMKLDLP